MIRTQMCHVFIEMYNRVRNGSDRLPTTQDILREADIHPGVMPYLNLWHPEEGDCRIGIFAPAWLRWLEVSSAPRFLSQLINPERAARKSATFLQATNRGFGFHEIGYFSVREERGFFVETVSLPARCDGVVNNMFNFAVTIPKIASEASPPASVQRWLDLGNGVPSETPVSTLSLAA